MRGRSILWHWILPALALIIPAASLAAQSPARRDAIASLDPGLGPDQVFRDEAMNAAIELTSCGAEFAEPTSEELVPQWATLADVLPLWTGDASLADAVPVSDLFPTPMGGYAFVDYDAFRAIPDGSWGNYGIRVGGNVAARLGEFSDVTGIGLQVGASVGAYDWAGTNYRMQNRSRVQTQGFFTYGLYHRPTENSRITAGLVQDWAFNDTYSVFGTNATMSQLRGQLGYATSASNEFGLWGTVHVVTAERNIPLSSLRFPPANQSNPTRFQSINHISAYWHHKWNAGGPDTWISVGVPEHSRLSGGGSLGDYLVSATALCPLNDVVAVNASVTYVHQSAGPGGEASREDAWNYVVGISIFPGRNARAQTVAGRRWMPLLPVANNGSFLVDASNGY